MVAGGRTELLANPTRSGPECPLMRLPSILVLVALMLLALAAPALAAKPEKLVISLDDPIAEENWSLMMTEQCGAPIEADFAGTLTVHILTNRHGVFKREIDKYWARDRFTNVETGASVVLKDVGPDMFFFRKDGALYMAIIGRSLTGSGVIGRTLINLDTGEVVRQSGKVVGSVADQVCPLLT